LRLSTTDPDATPMLMGEGEAKLGYQTPYAVEGEMPRLSLQSWSLPTK
jgi:hypothetical protein